MTAFVATIGDMPEIALDRRRIVVTGVVLLLAFVAGGQVPAAAGEACGRCAAAACRRRPRRVGSPRRRCTSTSSGPFEGPACTGSRDGSRVADAVTRAGGPTPKAQIELVNLAARIADGEQIVVPRARVGRRSRADAGRRRGLRPRPSEQRDARAARRTARSRPGHRAEDPRLPPEARGIRVGRRARCDLGHRARAARDAPRPGRAVSELVVVRRSPQLLAASLCLGLAAANAVRVNGAVALVLAALVGSAAFGVPGPQRLLLVAGALALLGWCWGSNRLDALDRSPLSSRIDTAERAQLVVTGPVHAGKFDIRTPAVVKRFGRLTLREPVLLKLPRGRAPPQGAILEALVIVTAPRGPENGFDERTWLRRHGVHVVLRVDDWRIVGRRGGIGGVADAVRRRLRHSVARGLDGERAAVIEGVVLGEDNGLSDELRRSFRASGLYHLLAVSGQNVALVAASAVLLTWLLGLPRLLGELGALAAIGGLRARGRRPAFGHPCRDRRCARLARLAHRARGRPLASAARRGDRPARLESVHAPRRRLSVLVRGSGRDLRPRPALRALSRGISAGRAAADSWSRSRPPAVWRPRRSPGCSSIPSRS